jgi:hypothetical protein
MEAMGVDIGIFQ